MSRILAIILPLLILVILGGGGALIIHSLAPVAEEAPHDHRGLSAFIEPVERINLEQSVTTQGTVTAKREVIVAPQIAGRISYISDDFIDGGFIREGQVLARLEAEDYELAVIRARSGVASAQQALASAVADAEIARQEILELGYTDVNPLALREPQLAQARAALAGAEAQLSDAQLALARTAIVAPFTGRVREQSGNVGLYVGPGQSLGRIFDTSVVEVALPVTDDELGRIGLPLAFVATSAKPGPTVTLRANVGGIAREWMGHISRTSSAVNPRTRQISLYAEVVDPFGEGADNGAPLAPGLFVESTIAGATLDGIYKVSRNALRGTDRVYVADTDTGRMEIRTVDVAFSDPEGAYIRSGLGVGEMVIVSPLSTPVDGMRVSMLRRLDTGEIEAIEVETEDDDHGGAE